MQERTRRPPTAKPLADLLQPVLAPSLAVHGIATSQLITRWTDIVGPELAAATRPLRISWPQRPDEGGKQGAGRPTGATLVLLCESGIALDVQHAIPLILERINALYGWQAITRITLRQGPVQEQKTEEIQQVNEEIAASNFDQVEDENLRRALARLSASVSRKRD